MRFDEVADVVAVYGVIVADTGKNKLRAAAKAVGGVGDGRAQSDFYVSLRHNPIDLQRLSG